MPAPLVVPLPAHVQAVYAQNADADPAQELIVEIATPAGSAPDKVSLIVLHFTATGALERQDRYDLGNRALAWDSFGALWGVDRDGLVRLNPGAEPTRVAKLSTPLAALGATRPIQSSFAHDLDGDGAPELLVYAAGRVHGCRPDGSSLGSVEASPEGQLAPLFRAGGSALEVRVQPPAFAVGDMDGDGKKDLVIPAAGNATIAYTGDTLGVRRSTIRLPVDLEPRDETRAPGQEKREIAEIWFRDFDGDGKLDLGLYRWVTRGSFFGATAEVLLCRGDGSSFGPPKLFATKVAAFGLRPVDVDADGDLDLVGPLVDVGVANITRALVSQEVRVDLSLFRMTGGAWTSEPVVLHTLPFPISAPDRLQARYEADLTGDRRPDLVTNDAQDRVRLYPASSAGLATSPTWDQAVAVPVGEDTLITADLDGDGRAEVVVWGRDQPQLSVLRAP